MRLPAPKPPQAPAGVDKDKTGGGEDPEVGEGMEPCQKQQKVSELGARKCNLCCATHNNNSMSIASRKSHDS